MLLALSLFWAAFLAATILPFSSEAALSAALAAGLPWGAALAAATLGNSAGSMTTWYLGRLGRLDWLKKYCRVTEEPCQKLRDAAHIVNPTNCCATKCKIVKNVQNIFTEYQKTK